METIYVNLGGLQVFSITSGTLVHAIENDSSGTIVQGGTGWVEYRIDSGYHQMAGLSNGDPSDNFVVTVTGATFSYDYDYSADNILTINLSNPTADVVVNVTAKPTFYKFTTTITHASWDLANLDHYVPDPDVPANYEVGVLAGTTKSITAAADSGYALPDTVTVTNVQSYVWTKSTGVLAITARRDY